MYPYRPSSVKCEKKKRAGRRAIKNHETMPDGAPAKRAINVFGEHAARRAYRRGIKRADRRATNVQLHAARYLREDVDVVGRPYVNLINATHYLTS